MNNEDVTEQHTQALVLISLCLLTRFSMIQYNKLLIEVIPNTKFKQEYSLQKSLTGINTLIKLKRHPVDDFTFYF